jgi:hypothetical protein
MERSRFRTLLGIGLIVLGVIFLSRVLAQPMLAPLPALPPLPPLPRLPPLPALPFLHRGWFSPPLLLIGLAVLALVWHRRSGCAAAK